ncbi:hypothetical protein OC709_02410 ['Planchonia careya' phytoplasma]|nr:hypothetical protein ['Planchonia careya' phytoplasma]MDO8030345.1 hypothetical protein ['Planchonia careya' phytoplasma]
MQAEAAARKQKQVAKQKPKQEEEAEVAGVEHWTAEESDKEPPVG